MFCFLIICIVSVNITEMRFTSVGYKGKHFSAIQKLLFLFYSVFHSY